MSEPYQLLSIDDLIAGLAPGSNCVLVDVQAALIIRGAEAVLPLIAVLHDENVHLAANAAAVLGRIGDSRAVPDLIELLQAFEWVLREQAAIALGRIGNKAAIAALKAALHDEVRSVRRAAEQSLMQLQQSLNP